MVVDIDLIELGMEVWLFYGFYNVVFNDFINGNISLYFYLQLSVWWDGDEFWEFINDGNVNKWDYMMDRNM